MTPSGGEAKYLSDHPRMLQIICEIRDFKGACHRPHKIWDLVYKIVQNEYKIMIQFFMLKVHLGGCMSPDTPKFELRIAEEGRVYKIWDLVYKIV